MLKVAIRGDDRMIYKRYAPQTEASILEKTLDKKPSNPYNKFSL